ncbi:MAG: hypothetical protein ABGX20_14790 [Bacillus sp. (in: firmicutes)]
MVWIVLLLFMIYVVFSLSTIKYQLKLITKHLNVKDEEHQKVSNDVIEKDLENYSKNNNL